MKEKRPFHTKKDSVFITIYNVSVLFNKKDPIYSLNCTKVYSRIQAMYIINFVHRESNKAQQYSNYVLFPFTIKRLMNDSNDGDQSGYL